MSSRDAETRRRFLGVAGATLAAVVGVAGCAGPGDEEEPAGEPGGAEDEPGAGGAEDDEAAPGAENDTGNETGP